MARRPDTTHWRPAPRAPWIEARAAYTAVSSPTARQADPTAAI